MKNLGIALICISAFLYGTRYLAAAIYGSNSETWSKALFQKMLDYVGPAPLILSWISLASGILLLIIAGSQRLTLAINDSKRRFKEDLQTIKENWNKDLDER